MAPRFSIIVPVYNRPGEINELLQSLVTQSRQNFEVIIVEDGSQITCKDIVDRYTTNLSIRYFLKENGGPGPARNFGFQKARGEYFVVFDSDCIIPSEYFSTVEEALVNFHYDAWGGPDRAHENFTILQRAMGYTMASVLTTGGIRGGKKHVGWFQPRSFNMGISADVFRTTGGFTFTHFAEDIELSIRMKKAGFKIGLIENAFVYHKRRTNFNQFFRQVFNFGKGRALLGAVHPEEIKLTHWFPTLFTMGVVVLFFMPLISVTLFKIGVALLALYFGAIFLHAFMVTRHLLVAALSMPSALLQLTGYGLGFLNERTKAYFR